MIVSVTETGSTNADLSVRLRAGQACGEGWWLVSDRQSAGRGRLGREWLDGAGNFMGSTVVWPTPGDPPLASLALVAGIAVHAAVSSRLPPPLRATIKWPNDIMLGAAKLAGILLEREGDAVIVGIGVNLAQAPQVQGRETAAVSAFAPAPDRDTFAKDLTQAFAGELARWRTHGLAATLTCWTAAAHPVGTPLVVGGAGSDQLVGTFAGLSVDGALQLRLADGTTQTMHAGEVRYAD